MPTDQPTPFVGEVDPPSPESLERRALDMAYARSTMTGPQYEIWWGEYWMDNFAPPGWVRRSPAWSSASSIPVVASTRTTTCGSGSTARTSAARYSSGDVTGCEISAPVAADGAMRGIVDDDSGAHPLLGPVQGGHTPSQ